MKKVKNVQVIFFYIYIYIIGNNKKQIYMYIYLSWFKRRQNYSKSRKIANYL